MPKSKKRKRTRSESSSSIDWGASAAPKNRLRERIIIGVVLAVVVVGGGGYLWQTSTARRAFGTLASQDATVLSRVATEPDDGRRHLDAGERWRYDSRYPTSGPHQTVWVRPGFYDQRQNPLRLVHALEHGNVVIYFDRQPPDVIDTLQDWAGLFTGQWDGLVVARDPGLGPGIVLTAWTKKLELDRFDAATAAAFIDAFRGRGPENPVR